MSVLFSSWGCESGTWTTGDCLTTPGATFLVPLTFNIYASNGGVPGALLASQTQTVSVLYRPSADATHCTGNNAGKWYNAKDRMCYNGFPQLIKMTFASALTLTDEVVWSVAFNTTTSGYSPIGVTTCNAESGGCGYDSLNVGAFSFATAPYAGTDINEDEAFVNGSMETGWTGFRPLGTITTK